MPNKLVIDKDHARRFVLSHLNLLPPRKLRGKQGVLDYFRRVNCIQYDPINIVGQNPHLVLQSRVANYKPAMLDALLYVDRELIDGFDKQMSIYPIEDWPQFAYYRKHMAIEQLESPQTAAAVKFVEPVRKEISRRGPLSSIDLEEDTRMDWWLAGSVRAVRIAMDILFYRGDTVVHHRKNTRRYFDLSKRVLPLKLTKITRLHASHEEYMDWHVFRRTAGVGLLHINMNMKFGGLIGWGGGRPRFAMNRLVEKGKLIPVSVNGLEREKFYIRRDDMPTLKKSARTLTSKPGAAFIAPLDNLMWDRKLLETLFDFYYSWEVYIPAEKRNYGYYVLPVLYGDRFVARLDPQFERAGRVFRINNWWWEKDVDQKDETMLSAIGECVAAFAKYLGANTISLGENIKREPGLQAAVKAAGQGIWRHATKTRRSS